MSFTSPSALLSVDVPKRNPVAPKLDTVTVPPKPPAPGVAAPATAAALVAVGAFFFYLSDIILAWNKFVAPIKGGRIYNIGAYHLGQIALIAGVIAQFS